MVFHSFYPCLVFWQARLKAAEEQRARTAAEKQAAVQELQEQVREQPLLAG